MFFYAGHCYIAYLGPRILFKKMYLVQHPTEVYFKVQYQTVSNTLCRTFLHFFSLKCCSSHTSWKVRIVKYRLESTDCKVPVGKYGLESTGWKVRDGKYRLESTGWKVRDGKYGMESTGWKVRIVKYRLES